MRVLGVVLLLAVAASAQGKPRVFLTDQQSWIDSPNLVKPAQAEAPSHTEQVNNLAKYCPAVTITADASKADFILVWRSTSYEQTRWGGHEHEWTVYNPQKDVIGTGAEYHMKNAAKDICKALTSSTASASPTR